MFYVLPVAVVMVSDLCFLGDVHMKEVQIIGFFGGKVLLGILGGNLGYLISSSQNLGELSVFTVCRSNTHSLYLVAVPQSSHTYVWIARKLLVWKLQQHGLFHGVTPPRTRGYWKYGGAK